MQGKNYLRWFCRSAIALAGIAILFSCKSTSRIEHYESSAYPLNKPGYTAVDSSYLALINPYKQNVDSIMDIVLAESNIALEKNQPEGLLGNLIADITLEEANKNYRPDDGKPVEFCFLNNGGLRAPLPKGKITKRNIYEVMPFDNELVIVTLTGSSTLQLFNFISQKGGVPVSNINMKITNGIPSDILINKIPFDSLKNYKFATSDYLANGGDNLKMMNSAVKKEHTGILLRDAIINNVTGKSKSGIMLTAKIEGRIFY